MAPPESTGDTETDVRSRIIREKLGSTRITDIDTSPPRPDVDRLEETALCIIAEWLTEGRYYFKSSRLASALSAEYEADVNAKTASAVCRRFEKRGLVARWNADTSNTLTWEICR